MDEKVERETVERVLRKILMKTGSVGKINEERKNVMKEWNEKESREGRRGQRGRFVECK